MTDRRVKLFEGEDTQDLEYEINRFLEWDDEMGKLVNVSITAVFDHLIGVVVYEVADDD